MIESASFSQIVVVGASAGGTEALSTFVRTLPDDLPAPVVLAQHLDLSGESRLEETLRRASALPVRTLEECERLEPGIVYVVPANCDVEITDHDIRLLRGTHPGRPSIDHLLTSAAEIFAENLVAVILTGTGNDGAAGVLDVRHAGGTVIIQDPLTATCPALPCSLAPSAVDFAVPLEEVGPLLRRLLLEAPETEDADEKATRFFRDPDLFTILRERVLPDIIAAARERDHTIRVWSAGCATGEEAYSLAILLAECLGDELEQFHVRIFATDLDADAIAFARKALYAGDSFGGVDAGILERYFDEAEGGYQISRRIRALVVFGRHDLADRAPFPRVDMVLCRNVLTHFTFELQRRILQLFAFSLCENGHLILGKSETTSPFAEAFVPDDSRLKVYRRRGVLTVTPCGSHQDIAQPVPARTPSSHPAQYGLDVPPQPPAALGQPYGPMADAVLFDLPVGVIVVDRRYDIQYINAMARSLLGIHGTAVGDDLIHLLRVVPGMEVQALIDRAVADSGSARGIFRSTDGASDQTHYLEILCRAEATKPSNARVSVCVTDATERVEERLRLERDHAHAEEARERAEQNRTHLAGANHDLLSANQLLTREVAELRSENEEFLVGNEELRAVTDEVEMLNQELQATNEELETLNEELKATVEELNTTNDHLQMCNAEIRELAVRLESARTRLVAVLNSLDDAIVVVDCGGRTVLTNTRYDQLFGGPLEEIQARALDGAPLSQEAQPHRRGARGDSFVSGLSLPLPDGSVGRWTITGRPIQGALNGGGVLLIREVPAVTHRATE